jgi:regulator of replication initiation timing
VTEVDNLAPERLKRVQAQMSRFEDKLNEVAADMRGIKQHMAAFMTSEANQDAAIASLQVRLDRIERRLDLID